MDSEEFGQSVKPTAAIRQILDTYPFSVGLLREILQNSDDAKATTQIFLLDHRTHAKEKLLHGKLASAQGPALLAYNDAIFEAEDWVALQHISESSKRTDTSKIGKYGIGFRSCYHVTDMPQILSDRFLAVFDPHQTFNRNGGTRVNITVDHARYSDHLSAMNFGILNPGFTPEVPFSGTIIRLPLRQDGSESEISNKTVNAVEIHQLLLDFVQAELPDVLLFLSHLSSIRVIEVDDHGVRCLGRVDVGRTPNGTGPNTRHETASVRVISGKDGAVHSQDWRIVRTIFSTEECAAILSNRLGRDITNDLHREKLKPAVSLAFPTPLGTWSAGRLFTYLPLPLPTGFPCHVHSLFALTPSRQNLRNASEKGIVHGARDELLVEWNKTLFDEYVPRAWALSLEIIASLLVNPDDIVRALPPASQDTPGGDPSYWRNLVVDLIRTLVREQQAVWPLVDRPAFGRLQDVFIAMQDDKRYLSALSAAGLLISVPPAYVVQTMTGMDASYQKLTPEGVQTALRQDVSCLDGVTAQNKTLILEFLLSTNDAAMMIGVPVVPLVNGRYVALEHRDSASGREFVLLESEETVLFGSYRDNSISLGKLPPTFSSLAPPVANVALLQCAQVVQYLEAIDSRLEGPTRTQWLYRFWVWLTSWRLRDQVLPDIKLFSLLPANDGNFQSLTSALFHARGIATATQAVLSRWGLRFLSSDFPPAASTYLEQRDILKSATDISVLLVHLRPRALDNDEIVTLTRHIIASLAHLTFPLSADLQSRLRALPLFPLLQSPGGTINASRVHMGLIPKGKICLIDIKNVTVLELPSGTVLLPLVHDMVFIARAHSGVDFGAMISHIDASVSGPSSEVDLMNLCIEHFTNQTRTFHQEFLTCIVAHRQRIPPTVILRLRRTPFVAVQSGMALRASQDVVDPDSALASLFDPGDSRLPRMSDTHDQVVTDSMRSLSLLRDSLSDDILKELLHKINNSSSLQRISVALFTLLNGTEYDCSRLSVELGFCWLPTSRGLRRPVDCRDHTVAHDRVLFDRVLDILDVPDVKLTSRTLRNSLEWDKPISLDVLKRQLDAELRAEFGSSSVNRLSAMITELGRRVDELTDSGKLEEFRNVTLSRSRIPVHINVTTNDIHPSSRALIGHEQPPPGFYNVLSKLSSEEGIRKFLLLMGCCERPSNAALLEELHSLGSQSLSEDKVRAAVRLLKALDTSALSEAERDQILVPDFNFQLRPLEQVYSDDIGVDAYDVELPEGRCRTHEDVNGSLVLRLGLQTLSSLNLKRVELDDDDMHEDLTTRISNVLRQYSVDQAFNEFLANAADAGADEFNIMLDKRQHPATRLMSPRMASHCPALISHNNTEFTEEDFKGIRRVGLGGKQDRADAIGKFGLGALAIFHFTELPMIISGTSVMFLDPSRSYLPPNGRYTRSAIRIPIANMRQYHPEHLQPLHGVYDFDMNADTYCGTIFRLPLRTRSQASSSRLSKDAISSEEVIQLLSDHVKVAEYSLLNIPVNSMTCTVRDSSIRSLWSVKTTREITNQMEDLESERVEVATEGTELSRKIHTWHIVTERAKLEALPAEFVNLASKHKLRHLSVTLAGLVSVDGKATSSRDTPQCRLYSKLPLPTLTSLPVHVDAPFILADDRRSIRFDESGQVNVESQYNLWLLSNSVPRLYTFLLQTWPQLPNAHLWPGNIREDDPISRIIIDAFYSEHFASSTRTFCDSMLGARISPSDALFMDKESEGVNAILEVLKPSNFVQLPTSIRAKALSSRVRRVDAAAIRDLILCGSNTSVFTSAFQSKTFQIEDIDALISSMLEESSDSILDLPIVPLADNTLGAVGRGAANPIFVGSWSDTYTPWPLFPPKRFMHPELQLSRKKLVDLNLNVCAFSGEKVEALVREILSPAGQYVRVLTVKQQTWVALFWGQFDRLGISSDPISSFPLVPTRKQDVYTSLEQCKKYLVLLYPSQPFIARTLDSFGASHALIDKEALPSALRMKLPPGLGCTFDDILRFFKSFDSKRISDLVHAARTNRSQDHDDFADFARRQLPTLSKHAGHACIARQLPIWEATCNQQSLLLPASDSSLKMLPAAVTLSVVSPFLEPGGAYMDFSKIMSAAFDVKPMTFIDLRDSLNIPSQVPPQHVPAFKRLVRVLIAHPSHDGKTLDVPNANGTMVNANTLYAYSNTVFCSVFASKPEHLLHRECRELESQLVRFGLHDSMTLAAFQQCARNVDHDLEETGQTGGVSQVYTYYSEELWRFVTDAVGPEAVWYPLDGLRFIPRATARRNYPNQFEPDLDFSEYARPMPDVVSPNNILRAEHEAIAWTQRALFQIAPSQDLLIANPSLGVPTAKEVVEHLRTLMPIADKYSCNSNLISDLMQTYRWLNKHADDCRPFLQPYAYEKLFLNVDDPNITWNFAYANQLIFNDRDEGHRQYVRSFLLPFKALILAAGEKEITDIARPALKLTPAEEVLLQWRKTLNQHRLKQRLTDVVLRSSDKMTFHAHRLVLSAEIRYFRDMFSGRWDIDGPVAFGDVSGETLGYAIDYLYTRAPPFAEVSDKDLGQHQDQLLELLELSHEWDFPDLFKQVENQLIATISFDTYEHLHEEAETYDAGHLLGACIEWEQKNAHAL